MKKVLKKGKRGNKKERSVAYEEMKSLNDSSTRIGDLYGSSELLEEQ
jgi:hypothetical protein